MNPSTIKFPRPRGRPRAKDGAALDHATRLILRVCQLAGSASFVADARESLEAEGVHAAVRTRNTAALFDWNQTAYALHLFIRDVAGGDLVGWIDRRLNTAAKQPGPDRLARMRAAALDPLKEVYGVSDKVLMMALSVLFLGAPGRRRRWREVGGSMIAVDTLVHNFLHRTGILRRFRADHGYGLACYRLGGCAEIIETVAELIDARQFNRRFPRTFPRFVQHAIWRYCSQQGLDICNGNQIDDQKRCDNKECALYSICERKILFMPHKST